RRIAGALPSLAGHLAILAIILLIPKPLPVTTVEDAPISVSLVPGDKPAPVPKAEEEAPKPKAEPPKHHSLVRRAAAKAPAEAPPAGKDPKPPQSGVELSSSDLAGAASADSGGGGGQCDLARQLQGALRKDPLVQAAVASAEGKAIMVWNGDWVRSQGEDGKGLAAVREAIIWEIAFAPEACRSRPVHGLILLSMHAGPGAARLAVGAGEWRWSDLLRSTSRQ
ncbi:MAG: hypothetical protein ACXWK0_07450, partial [Caulobacteraceae bacterium]